METTSRPKLGLALGGSGSRTSFYIGFLEVFDEEGITIDYISASSGASIIASAYACGSLSEIKEWALSLGNENIKQYISQAERGGLYSLDGMEQKMREFTQGKTFDEVRPLMSFATVDIETGQQINLCMGDIAKACRISCTLPGIFEPEKWGNRTLVDGGLLNLVPVNALKQFPVDITIGVDIPGTKFIFTGGQMTLRKVFNMAKKILFVNEMGQLLSKVFGEREIDLEKSSNFFSVLGKSMDLAIKANKHAEDQDMSCDLMITPDIPKLKPKLLVQYHPFYEMGRECALAHVPRIKTIITQKEKVTEIVH
jgi:NTE family protein